MFGGVLRRYTKSVGFYDLHTEATPFTAQRFIQSSLNFGNSCKDFSIVRVPDRFLAGSLECARFRHFVEFTFENCGDLKGFGIYLDNVSYLSDCKS